MDLSYETNPNEKRNIWSKELLVLLLEECYWSSYLDYVNINWPSKMTRWYHPNTAQNPRYNWYSIWWERRFPNNVSKSFKRKQSQDDNFMENWLQTGEGIHKGTRTLPSMKSWVPILTTVHPIALAELRHNVWFSFLSHGLSILFIFIARSSIVPGTATLISLLQ